MQARGRGPGGGHFPAFSGSTPWGGFPGPGRRTSGPPGGLGACKTPPRRSKTAPSHPQTGPGRPQNHPRTCFRWVLGGKMDAIWHQNGIRKHFCVRLASRLKTIIFVVPEWFLQLSNWSNLRVKTDTSRVQNGCPDGGVRFGMKIALQTFRRRAETPQGGPNTPQTSTQGAPKMTLKPSQDGPKHAQGGP